MHDVARGMGLDGRIGRKFLHPGPGYGGSCFPKDALALLRTAQEAGARFNILETVVRVNDERKKRMADKIIEACGGSIAGKTIAVLGLTFKPNTDDMRDAPSLVIVPALQKAGATVRAFDPAGMAEARKLLDGVAWCEDAYDTMVKADALTILTEWNEFRALDLDRVKSLMNRPLLVDLRNISNPEAMAAAGLSYRSPGRPAGAPACGRMVSGSAASPVPTLGRWQEVTGQRLLGRYGMTEIGMALSNPVDGERRAGHVGQPLPGIEVRLVDEAGSPLEGSAGGEIQVRGPTVFSTYWEREHETRAAFAEDGWFSTGDQAVLEDGAYRILGRSSVDILKTGGEKISALEIEDVLRSYSGVVDCAVVGVPDADWGDRVCAAVVCEASQPLDVDALRGFARERLAPYKVPKDIILVDALPRNAMDKVIKPTGAARFAGDAAQ